jgi:RNA polymerase subunit RPABC4/transcription elongation factor Spt4
MARPPQVGVCKECHTLKPLFDVKNGICGQCAGKKGGSTPKRPRMKFFCEKCKGPVHKHQEKCPSCGAAIDWEVRKAL